MIGLRLSWMIRPIFMLLFAVSALAQPAPQLPAADAVRLREFYRLEHQVSEIVWAGWSQKPAPLLLVTNDTEFLTHFGTPPKGFQEIDKDLYFRPRQFPTGLLATFPAFGPPSIIVIGEPEKTSAQTSTPWLITLMHEHFHQFQDEQPGIYVKINALGLAHGDTTGMWMLNYSFPYQDEAIDKAYAQLRDLLLFAVQENDAQKFQKASLVYIQQRHRFMSMLKEEDRKYLSFQLWKEGVARYVQIKSAEEAARNFHASEEYKTLSDYESFASYGAHARLDTIEELKRSDLRTSRREVVYAYGAAEALLLDRLYPTWRERYFQNLFTLDPYFER